MKIKLFLALACCAVALVWVARNAIRSNHWSHWFPPLSNMGYRPRYKDEDNK